MIYFLLPNTFSFSFKNIEYQECNDNFPLPVLSQSLSFYLNEIKEKINQYEVQWDIYKKYTNPYEYIHTVIPAKKKSISKYKPLSRSYFKMIEILHLFKFKFQEKNIRTFHLAEGPGGFIEAILNMRNNPEDLYTGMTLLDDSSDKNIPTWKKTFPFLRENKNVVLENGADGTGNILSLENLIYCQKKYESSMHFITADGGFDFSFDFNSQEINISKLLFAQICFALCMQAKNGFFVLKIFDCFMQHTIDLLYLLSSFYKKVYITKPQTSRYANSEKYIVCCEFLFSSTADFFPFLVKAFTKMILYKDSNIFRFFKQPIPMYFSTKVEEYNSIFGQQQIDNIYYTISLIESKNKTEKIDILIKNNIQKSIIWCAKHNIDINL
jgi:23S rRNA U2552 (ribose-2'-O)-methylase RlmE/FtsJ